MNKRHYEHTLPNIRGSLSNTYCITFKYRRYENLHIYLLGSGHAGCMACHKPDNTCQKTASLYDRRTQTYRLLSGTVERHRLESGQAENPEGFFQGNLCITF